MKEIRKTNWLFLILITAFTAVSFGGGFLYQLIANFWWADALFILLPELLMLGIAAIYIKGSGKKFGETIRLHKLSPLTIFLLIIMGIFLIPVVSFINALSMMFATNLVGDTIDTLSDYGFLFSLFAIAVVPAFVEEVVYRGIFANTYMKRSYIKGALLSAFLFGIMHMNFNQFSYAFFIGIVFAFVMEITGSILSSIILHFMINGSSIVSYFIVTKVQDLLGEQEVQMATDSIQITWEVVGAYFLPAVFSGSIFLFLLWLIGKSNGRFHVLRNRKSENETIFVEGQPKVKEMIEEKKERLWTWQLVVATILCCVIAIVVEIGNRIP